MENCLLCGGSVIQIPPNGAYAHVECKRCGQYKISFPALSLSSSEQFVKIKHLIAGDVFNNSQHPNDPFLIDSKVINDFDSKEKENLPFKLFKLALYCYTLTKENGFNTRIENLIPQCGYAKDEKELNGMIEFLKKINILNFNRIESLNANGNGPNILFDITITASALMVFEDGIDSVDDFKSSFMKNGSLIQEKFVFAKPEQQQDPKILTENKTDLFDIKPNFFGLGVNLNEVWHRFTNKLKAKNGKK